MKVNKIYFDMDGVLTDFDGAVEALCRMQRRSQEASTPEQDDLLWARIRQVPHFFGRLEPLPGALELFRQVYKKYGDRVEILTGIPKERRGIVTAAEDKRDWVKRYLSDEVVVNTVYKAEKPSFCREPGDVLVDDLRPTIRKWKELGGFGILHENAETTLKILMDLEN